MNQQKYEGVTEFNNGEEMSIFKWIYQQFNPPKTDNQNFEDQAWKDLKYRKSPEGRRRAEIEKEIRKQEAKHMDDINPWTMG